MNLERVQLPGAALWLPATDEPRNILGQTLRESEAMKIIDRTNPQANKFAKFTGHRSFDQVVAECKAQGVEIDVADYVNKGSDWIWLKGGGFQVAYCTVNGNFFGTTPECEKFASHEPRDGCAWFDALLGFFYFSEVPA